MKKIIEILKRHIMDMKTESQGVRTAITGYLMEKSTIELLPLLPDDINISELRKRVLNECQSKLDYVEKLLGWFSNYPDEPQIELALEYLNEIVQVLKLKINRSIALTGKLYKKYQRDIDDYTTLLKKVETYNNETYIDEKEFLLLVNSITEDELDVEIIELLACIGKNNALIRLKSENNDHIFGIDKQLYETIDRSRNSENGIKNTLMRIEKALKSNTFMYAMVGDLKLVEDIKECFNDFLNIETSINDTIFEEADLFKEELEIIDDKNVFIVAVVLLILDALEQNNGKLIAPILDKYRNSNHNTTTDQFEIQLLNSKRSKVQKIIDEYYVESEYSKFISSYCNIPEQQLAKFIDMETIQNMKIMELIHSNYDNIDSMSAEELDDLIKALEEQIAIYQDLQRDFDNKSIENNIDGLDITDVLNYVVFLSPERIEQNIEDIMVEHDVKLSLFVLAIYKLFMISQGELYSRDTCKPIMETEGKSNEYDIREERAGAIRICFKTITTRDNHVIYEVLSFAFGSCGDKRKNDNLKLSFKEYADHYEEYKAFEQVFYENDSREMTRIIDQGLTFYNQLYNRNKKKKLGD